MVKDIKLTYDTIDWTIKHLSKFNDTDLFPRPIEYDILSIDEKQSVDMLSKIDVTGHEFGQAKRFIVPKDELSYRPATQLDPLDNIILTAIIYQYGNLIENRRIPVDENRVFSYRFSPQSDGTLYDSSISWSQFWACSKRKAVSNKFIVYLDIADFYNQIYHHTIDNQLLESQFPNQMKRWIMDLLKHLTAGVSRGIPIGPHAAHLIAELSMIPIDNSILTQGLDFCRFVDDILIFSNDEKNTRSIVYRIAEILDKQQRLILQRKKTKIFSREDFMVHCDNMLKDRPINKFEKDILSVIRKHAGDNPYLAIDLKRLSDDDLRFLSPQLVGKILDEYLKGDEPNYVRLRWFLRRLSQIGTGVAVDYCINHLSQMTPAISDVCHYLIAASDNYDGDWERQGQIMLEALSEGPVGSNEYLQLAILNLFARNHLLDNLGKLVGNYDSSSSNIKRKIILAAYRCGAGDWIRGLKDSYANMDTWCKRALIIGSSRLPYDERKFFLALTKEKNLLSTILIKWAMKKSHSS